jgi:hypothetical protein
MYNLTKYSNASSNVSAVREVQVFCDMQTDGGGWTVIQRCDSRAVTLRHMRWCSYANKSSNFNRTWVEYVNGFGNITTDHWLGLENMRIMAAFENTTLRFDMCQCNGMCYWEEYETFTVRPLTVHAHMHVYTVGQCRRRLSPVCQWIHCRCCYKMCCITI